MSNFTCPYCEAEIDEPDDCNDPCDTYQHECPECEKSFVFTVDYTKYFSEYKADCLNGGAHDYQVTNTYPRRYAKLRCAHCFDEKPLPKELMNEFIKESP